MAEAKFNMNHQNHETKSKRNFNGVTNNHSEHKQLHQTGVPNTTAELGERHLATKHQRSQLQGSLLQGSQVQGSQLQGSQVQGSQLQGSQIQGSQQNESQVLESNRDSSNCDFISNNNSKRSSHSSDDMAIENKQSGTQQQPDQHQQSLVPDRSPSPRYRPIQHSGSTTPNTRSPTPTDVGASGGGVILSSSLCNVIINDGEVTRRSLSDDVAYEGGSFSGVSEGGSAEVKVERKPKSVSFHSHTNWKSERKIQSAEDCLDYMKEGSSLIKVRSNGRQYHRYFTLLEDLSAIHWTPSSKKMAKAQVNIDHIHEVRTGRNCESLRHHNHPLRYPEERIFSVLYGPAYQSLDLIAPSPEEATIWVTGLNALIGDANSPDTTQSPQPPLRERWLADMFKAECGERVTLDQDCCVRLINRLDPTVEQERILHKIQELDLLKPERCRGRLDSVEFIAMYKEVATRHEISCLLIRLANKEYFTLEDLNVFLEGEQGMTGLTTDKVKEVVNLYEPSPEARGLGQLHVDGLTRYLLSDECDIFEPRHRSVCQDMSQPLTHYFISSSHNTYLLEDQLKGPSSVDGLIRVLTCGCRCIKVDVHDGPTEPLVYHGNTLTSRVSFREVVDAIAIYSFDFSIYPVIVHLENHCSVPQQKLMVDLLTTILGPLLYVPPPAGQNSLKTCCMSPNQLKKKILLKGKKLMDEDVSEGEVTEEDEGGSMDGPSSSSNSSGSSSKGRQEKKKMKLWRGLSRLISITRGRHRENDPNVPQCQSLSESTALRFSQSAPEDLVCLNKSLLTRVYPNSYRVDSSNYNPQDFWNSGCQLVSLNFQTPGEMMDVYEGKFRSNGGSGYVLKPAVMREHISVFSATSKDAIPGVSPQLYKIKIISAQSLPKPRGSTASKASFLDPYVLIQVFGIPADCKEFQTRTVKNNSRFPVFDESFDVELHLPELALIRFVVLDDEYIGDDFIGQCSVPVSCIQTGYRHVRLLSVMGEPMDNVTLFVHITVSNDSSAKSHKNRGARKCARYQTEMRTVGLKQADELFKEAGSKLSACDNCLYSVENAWRELQQECGVNLTANMKQCLKVAITRFLTHPDNYSLTVVTEDGVPFIKRSPEGPLPAHLQRLESALHQVLQEIQNFLSEVDSNQDSLKTCLQPALALYDDLEPLLSNAGIKGKKANKARENFAWNVRIVRGQLDRLSSTKEKCKIALEQVESTRSTLSSFNRRDRSPSVRDKPRLALANRHHTTENLSNYGSLGRSPSSPSPYLSAEAPFRISSTPMCKPKSILKKSNSNIESGTLSYVDGEYYSGEYYCTGSESPTGSSRASGEEDEDDEEDFDDREDSSNVGFKSPLREHNPNNSKLRSESQMPDL